MVRGSDRLVNVLEHELRTVWRSRIYVGLAIGFTLLLVGLAILSGASAYVPLALTLLTPIELLVPILAAALGYRSILGDRERGELPVLRTYPVTREEYVGGVYLGRLTALLVTVVGPLLLIGFAVPVVGGASTFLPQPAGLDSPILYLRFVVLSGVFSAVMLAVMILLSAIVENSRRGLVLAIVLLLVLVIGIDLAAVVGLASGLGDAAASLAVVSPNSAYRALVMALVVKPVTTTPLAPVAPFASGVVLFLWFGGALATAAWQVWTPPR